MISPLEQVLTARNQEKITILCTVKKGTPPFKIEWLKDDIAIQSNENVKIKGDEEDSTLSIKSTRESDAGNYTCVARNAYGSHSFTTKLVVQGRPFGPSRI